jgi:hypothetical protein
MRDDRRAANPSPRTFTAELIWVQISAYRSNQKGNPSGCLRPLAR